MFYSYTEILRSWYGLQKVMLSYVILATVTAAIGTIVIPLSIHKIFPLVRNKNILSVGVITFVILTIMAILCGPYDAVRIFDDRVINTFFSEWNFTNYIFQVALPSSFVAAGLEFFFGKKYAVAIPVKTEDKILKL